MSNGSSVYWGDVAGGTGGGSFSGETETFSISIKNSSGTNVYNLGHGSVYTINAGGATCSFQTPTQTLNTAGSSNKASTKLFLVGTTSQASSTTSYSNSAVFIDTDNWLQATGFKASSDERLKTNIKDYAPTNSILDLPVKEFDFKEGGRHTIGCIAQDLRELFPELVTEDENGYLAIEENKLVYLLLLEVKKLKEEISKNK
jgi:hypothetical protein